MKIKKIKKLTTTEAQEILRRYWFTDLEEQEQLRHYARIRMHCDYAGVDYEL